MEATLIEQAIDNLQNKIGIKADWNPKGIRLLDGTITARVNNLDLKFNAEIKKEIRPHQLPAIKELAERYPDLMLIALRLPDPIKKELQQHKIAYLEGNGNIYIPNPKAYVHIETQKPLPAPGKDQNRAFTKTGLRVVFQLLLDEDFINLTYREMAAQLNIGLGNFNYVFNGLKKGGYLLQIKKNTYRLQNKKELFNRWVTEYKEKLEPELLMDTFRFLNEGDFLHWKKMHLDYNLTHWGGEPAAELLTGNLHPATLTLYTTETRMDIIRKYKLVPAKDGNVLLYQQFWKDIQENAPTAPPMLVYANLALQNDNRLIETAQKIYDEYLQTNL